MHTGTGRSARTQGIDAHEDGSDLDSWGGIVSGRLATYAAVLDCSAAAVLQAIDGADVDPMVDTARQKSTERERPTAPSLRCLAMTQADFQAVRHELDRDENAEAVAA